MDDWNDFTLSQWDTFTLSQWDTFVLNITFAIEFFADAVGSYTPFNVKSLFSLIQNTAAYKTGAEKTSSH